jgi:hypothetical protein
MKSRYRTLKLLLLQTWLLNPNPDDYFYCRSKRYDGIVYEVGYAD